MAPHQLFPFDEWGGVRQSLQLVGEVGGNAANSGGAREKALSTGVDSQQEEHHLETNSGRGSLFVKPVYHNGFSTEQGDVDCGPARGEGPARLRALEDALDDDDDIEEPSGLESDWQRPGDLGARHAPGIEIFVGGLTRSTRRDMLRDWFQRAGEVTEVRIARDKRRRRCRGYGYVRFATSEQANCAIETMHRFEFKAGRFLGVLPSDENRTLFVGGLKEEWTCEYIGKLLKDRMPGLLKVEPIPDREDRCKIRTFCFLEFATHAEAAAVINRYQVKPLSSQWAPQPFAGAGGGFMGDTDAMSTASSGTVAYKCDTRGCSSSSCHDSNNGGETPGVISEQVGGNPQFFDSDNTTRTERCVSASKTIESSSSENFGYGDGSRLEFYEGISGNINRTKHDDAGVDGWANQPLGGEDDAYASIHAGDQRRPSAVSHHESGSGRSSEDFPVWGRGSFASSPGGGVPLVVDGAILKLDWADPLRYHIHLNGGIKGPCAPDEMAGSDARAFPSGVRGRTMGIGPGRGGMGPLDRQGQHPEPSPRWKEAVGSGIGGTVYTLAGTSRSHQQHAHHPRQHSPHLKFDHDRYAQLSPQRAAHPDTGPLPSCAAVTGTLRTERARGYTISDPRSAFALSTASPHRAPYYDVVSTRQKSCDSGGSIGVDGRGRAVSYSGSSTTFYNGGSACPPLSHKHDAAMGASHHQHHQRHQADVMRGHAVPRFQPHPHPNMSTDVRTSSASEFSDRHHRHNFRLQETGAGAGWLAMHHSAASAIGGDKGSSVGPSCCNAGMFSRCSDSGHSRRSSSDLDPRVGTSSWSMTPPRRNTEMEMRHQQRQHNLSPVVGSDGRSWGREGVEAVDPCWPHDFRREGGGQKIEHPSGWIDNSRKAGHPLSSEASASTHRVGHDMHHLQHVEAMDGIGSNRSRTATGIETAVASALRRRAGHGRWEHEHNLVGHENGPPPPPVESHQSFSESADAMLLVDKDRVHARDSGVWPQHGGATSSSPTRYTAFETGLETTKHAPRPPSTSTGSLLNPLTSHHPANGTFTAPAPGGERFGGGGRFGSSQGTHGRFNPSVKAAHPPGFSMQQNAADPQPGATVGPSTLATVDSQDIRDWLPTDNAFRHGRGGSLWRGAMEKDNADIARSAFASPVGICSEVGRSWAGLPSVGNDDDGIGGQGKHNSFGSDSRVEQRLVWDTIGSGELEPSSSSGGGRRHAPWFTALLPRRGNGKQTWG